MKIDFVVTWVDGADEDWLSEKKHYFVSKGEDASQKRYRDFGLLKYWFRGVEQFAPWVGHVHFITCGHLPDWLNTSCPKLHVVKHSDYMQPELLPCFNSNAIELGIHRIEGLSERFVYFNDDMYLLRDTTEEDFFRNGLPTDSAVFSPVMPIWNEDIGKTIYNDMEIINKYFHKPEMVKNCFTKLLNPIYGKQLFRTVCLLPWRHIPGFYNDHIPISYLRSTFEKVWKLESERLSEVCLHRFRDYGNDVSHWLMRYWQLCSGDFFPVSPRRGADLDILSPDIYRIISSQKYKMICINDKDIPDDQFEQLRVSLIQAFNTILPNKSIFEK